MGNPNPDQSGLARFRADVKAGLRTRKPPKKSELAQIKEVLLDHILNPRRESIAVAGCARAYEVMEARERKNAMKPDPKPADVTKDKPKSRSSPALGDAPPE